MGSRACVALLVLASTVQAFMPGATLRLGQATSALRARSSSGLHMLVDAYTQGAIQIAGESLSYEMITGTEGPSVMYLPALDCPKYDLKATVIKRFCQGTKRTYLSADWFGVGESTGDFAQGTVTRWTADTIKLIESLCPDSKMVLVGGGVGGWVALLVALQRPDLVAGIVGLGADPDFTENLLWKHLPEETKTEIMEKGSSQVTWGIHQYPISRALIEDGRRHLLLGGPDNGLDIMCPVRLVHGLQDEEVPLDVPLSLARRLRTQNVQVLLQKSGDHYLGDQADFALIKTALKDCIANYYEYDLTSPGSG